MKIIYLIIFMNISCTHDIFNNKFEAKSGEYFPKYLKKVFREVDSFEKDYKSVADAADGIKLIELKKLSPNKGSFNESNISWSEDSSLLSYEVSDLKYRKIYLNNLVNNEIKEIFISEKSKHDFLEGFISKNIHSYNSGLSWSSNSSRFVFMSNGGIGNYDIFLGSIDNKERPLISHPSKDGYAKWSSDSSKIAFVSSRSGNGDIYLKDMKTHNEIQVTDSEHTEIFPEWIPAQNKVIYSSGNSMNHNIYLASIGNENKVTIKQLTNWTNDDLRPTISPDGKFVAFYSNSSSLEEPDVWNIHVIPLKNELTFHGIDLEHTVAVRNVVVDLNTGPTWSPDGKKILYVKKSPIQFNPIYVYDIYEGQSYKLNTKTKMNRDVVISKYGVLSFRAQDGVWDRVFVALTNQGIQLQNTKQIKESQNKKIYLKSIAKIKTPNEVL